MSSRKSKQQNAVARQKRHSIITLIALLLMFLFFAVFSGININICGRIRSKDLKDYSGPCTINESHRSRNTIYFVSLENGDILRISPELITNNSEFMEQSILHFTYSKPEFGFPNSYTCVGISSEDGSVCYMAVEDALESAKGKASIGVFFSVLTFALLILMLSIYFFVYHSKKKG